MCSAYNRLKKHSQLKQLAQQSNNDASEVEQNQLNLNLSIAADVSMEVDIICNSINSAFKFQ